MLSAVVIAVALLVAGFLAFSPKLAKSSKWQATVTPLASIMGSGFLVSAPLLGGIVGNLAVVCMALLLVLAFFVGSAIRFNIRHFEPIENKGWGPPQTLAFLSRVVLAGAYFVSISYYLQLLAAFVLDPLGFKGELAQHVVSTVLLVLITGIGMWRGLSELGSVEEYVTSLNLGVIASLIVALAIYNIGLAAGGTWTLPAVSSDINLHDFRILLGLLIVVQGFEASRYLGAEYSADDRILTMRRAQIISSGIYVLFIGLVTVLFHSGLEGDVTAIIRMTQPVAVVLPITLAIAAVGSQFSAAVADTEGAGGLIEDITQRKLPEQYAYLLILAVSITLTWQTNVNEIIAYASRAFAAYYAIQCVVAFLVAHEKDDLKGRGLRLASFALLAVICAGVFLFGLPSE